VVGISTLITVVYSLFLFNRVSFGSLKMQYIKSFSDLTRREVYIMVPLFIVNIVFGIFPNFFLGPVYQAVVIYMADSINLFDTR
jgi:NADH-quinone oxidoreductase subunit M